MIWEIYYIFVKNTPYGNGSSTFVCEQISNFFLDSKSSDTYLSVENPKVVPYYCVLLSNLYLKSSNFRRECQQRKLVILKSKFDP